MGEIQNYGRRWPPRRRRRSWLSVPGNILVLPVVGLIGLGLYLYAALGPLPSTATSTQIQFTPAMFSVDRDCADFRSQREAQAFLLQAGPGDPHRLDRDGDGRACELNGR